VVLTGNLQTCRGGREKVTAADTAEVDGGVIDAQKVVDACEEIDAVGRHGNVLRRRELASETADRAARRADAQVRVLFQKQYPRSRFFAE
jgi:hypothetical protein